MPTSPELKEALKNAADKIAQYVDDVATMTVVTLTAEVGVAGDPVLAARTVVKIDGDSETTIAMKKGPDGSLVPDTMVNEIHQTNVAAASKYRTDMMQHLLGLFKQA